MGKEGSGEEGINRYLGGAAHEGNQHNSHTPVPKGRQRPCGHDRRHGAAETDKQGNDASSRQADFTEQLIHDKGHSGHVSPVFQNGEKKEKHRNNGDETQYAPYAGEDTVHQKGLHRPIHPCRRKGCIHLLCQCIYAAGQKVLEKGADHIEGKVEHKGHDEDKNRNGRIFSCKDAVHLPASRMLPAFLRLHHRFM